MERRRHSRVKFQTTVSIRGEDGTEQTASLHDVSMLGLLVAVEKPLIENNSVAVTLSLGPDTKIDLRGTVVRRTADGNYGIRVEGMDVESLGHLYRLVALNHTDPTTIEQELFHSELGHPGHSASDTDQ